MAEKGDFIDAGFAGDFPGGGTGDAITGKYPRGAFE